MKDCDVTNFQIIPSSNFQIRICGSSSVGRATAFQAVGRGFEPRLPLLICRSAYGGLTGAGPSAEAFAMADLSTLVLNKGGLFYRRYSRAMPL